MASSAPLDLSVRYRAVAQGLYFAMDQPLKLSTLPIEILHPLIVR